jgi:predicted small metal-binding protein
MAEPNEETGLLIHDESNTILEATRLTSHERKESLLPEFIFTSIDNMAEVVNDITEHIEDMAHEVTTFEPLDVDALVAEHEAEREADAESLSPEEEEDEIEELIHPTDPMAPFVEREKLGVIPLAVMVFYSVSGGPFGCETSVRAGGYFYALLGFLVMPCIWSVQEALMTAELGTTFPEASGGVAWVEEAFGQNAGWMSGE